MKRFTDTDKWTRNKWFRKLSAPNKLFWLFILDNCDSVGVWQEDVELASMLINFDYDIAVILEDFREKIHIFSEDKKWWIEDFCDYQHGKLNEESACKPIQSYITTLKKHGLWKQYSKTRSITKPKTPIPDKPKVDKEEDLFEECRTLFGEYGTKTKALEYWGKLKAEDRAEIKVRIPLYLASLIQSGFKKKMFQGWINPKDKAWQTTYENTPQDSNGPQSSGQDAQLDQMEANWKKENGVTE